MEAWPRDFGSAVYRLIHGTWREKQLRFEIDKSGIFVVDHVGNGLEIKYLN